MKWTFVIQQKLKAALLLGGIMLVVVVSTILTRNNIEGIDKSFSSIYQDRLMPAIDIVYLSENLYNKRLLVEKHLLSDEGLSPAQLEVQLQKHNYKIDSLISVFSQTHMVDEESKSLIAFRQRVHEYSDIEQEVLRFSESGNKKAGQQLFEEKGGATFQRTIVRLNELTQIQSVIGQELVKESHTCVARSNNISTLQISLAVVIGLMVLGLIQSAKIIKPDRQPFNLN
ncbi:MCP four helix bundle domain-containing protein [Telluribacter humicola]|uniref:MCP four helix bundle domain-containing protein n=1 Tax=Telluribacter humicola TaxID=1720261 RepID=UPI001A96A09B|nr:MCP four helix bundle domain-containing protein [Telluribacter humicola]